jgi:hypothetical protein
MHPPPDGYAPVPDGDTIAAGDLTLGELRSSCGQRSGGWKRVASRWIGQTYDSYSLDPNHPKCLVRAKPR